MASFQDWTFNLFCEATCLLWMDNFWRSDWTSDGWGRDYQERSKYWRRILWEGGCIKCISNVLLDGQYKTSSGLNIKIQEISRWDICREQEGAEPSVITLPAPRLSGQDTRILTTDHDVGNMQQYSAGGIITKFLSVSGDWCFNNWDCLNTEYVYCTHHHLDLFN